MTTEDNTTHPGDQHSQQCDSSGRAASLPVSKSSRRQWLSAVTWGIVLASLVAFFAWLLLPQAKWDAIAVIRVRRELARAFETGVIGTGPDWRGPRETNQGYMTYKETQATLLKSEFVCSGALSDPNISQLPMVRQDRFGRRRREPVAWLQDQLKVDLDASEILRVRLPGSDGKQVATLLDAVVNTYMTEIVGKERAEKLARLELLRTRLRDATVKGSPTLERSQSDQQQEIDALQLELQSPSRIKLIQPATAPDEVPNAEGLPRVEVVVAWIATFGLTVALLGLRRFS